MALPSVSTLAAFVPFYRTEIDVYPLTGDNLKEEESTYITVELRKYNETRLVSSFKRIDICLNEMFTKQDSLWLQLHELLYALGVARTSHVVIIDELFEYLENQVIFGPSVSVMVVMNIVEVARSWLTEHDDDDDEMESELLDADTAIVKTMPASEEAIARLEKVHRHGEKVDSLCVICGDGMEEYTPMPCAHEFHYECLVTWLRTSNYCPLCRFQLFR